MNIEINRTHARIGYRNAIPVDKGPAVVELLNKPVLVLKGPAVPLLGEEPVPVDMGPTVAELLPNEAEILELLNGLPVPLL